MRGLSAPARLAAAALALAAAGAWAADRSDLDPLVRAYLSARTKGDRTRAYGGITRHPECTVARVTQAVRACREYPPAEPGIAVHEIKGRSGKVVSTYAAVVPQGYDPAKPWPLILALAGGRGDGTKYAPFWQKQPQGKDYLVICPVGRDPWWHTSYRIALAALSHACERYHVDRNRVCLTGMSNGGNGTWFLAMHYPDLFAAAAPMAGGPATSKGRVDYAYLLNLLKLPVYICHGDADETISIEHDRKAAEILTAQGYDCRLDEVKGGGHGSPQQHVPQILAWFRDKQRDPNPHRIRYRKQSLETTRCYWLVIGKTASPAAIEVEVAGPSLIEMRTSRARRVTLFLNDQLVNMQQPLTIRHNGRLLKTVAPEPSVRTLLLSAQVFGDPERLYPFAVSLNLGE